MGLKISGLNELRERLERLRPEEVMARALAEQANRMATRVRDGLSEPPGAAGHDEPWLRSGALRDSVGAEADGLQAVVGSSDPAAVPQELGTAHMPARPFLAPVAAGMGEEVTRAVGARVAAALRGEAGPVAAEDASAGSGIVQVSADGMDLPRAAGAALALGAIALYGVGSGYVQKVVTGLQSVRSPRLLLGSASLHPWPRAGQHQDRRDVAVGWRDLPHLPAWPWVSTKRARHAHRHGGAADSTGTISSLCGV